MGLRENVPVLMHEVETTWKSTDLSADEAKSNYREIDLRHSTPFEKNRADCSTPELV